MIALALAILKFGDIEVFMSPSECKELVEALKKATIPSQLVSDSNINKDVETVQKEEIADIHFSTAPQIKGEAIIRMIDNRISSYYLDK